IVAGYPWFTDWGRDTFIALRGLCLAGGRWDDARGILLQWADAVSQGMLPNRFPDSGAEPEFNAVDASLWYIVAAYEYLAAVDAAHGQVAESERRTLDNAVQRILTGYADGTRYGIHADRDGLLAAGQPGVQLTWMDAKVGDWVVTPRIGKPVEVRLLTPLGLRSLAPGERGYTARYEGGVAARDGAYHQGTVWPWLLGAFVEAWVRVHGGSAAAKRQARDRFLAPLLAHLSEAG